MDWTLLVAVGVFCVTCVVLVLVYLGKHPQNDKSSNVGVAILGLCSYAGAVRDLVHAESLRLWVVVFSLIPPVAAVGFGVYALVKELL